MNNRLILFFGILLGLFLLLYGVIIPNDKIEISDAVVSVNGHPIYQADLDLALQALSMNKRNEITDEDKSLVLERLIDEQLLLQRGLEIDLPQTEGMVRKSIVNSMIDKIVAEGTLFTVSDDVLIEFYQNNKDFFSGHSEVHIKKIFLEYKSQSEDEEKLDTIRELLIDGEDFDFVEAEYGDYILPEIPNMLLPIKKLKDYVEPDLVDIILNMTPGQITSEIETQNGYVFLYMLSSIRGEERDFQSVKNEVLSEYERRNDELSLKNYIEWLRNKSEIIYVQ